MHTYNAETDFNLIHKKKRKQKVPKNLKIKQLVIVTKLNWF